MKNHLQPLQSESNSWADALRAKMRPHYEDDAGKKLEGQQQQQQQDVKVETPFDKIDMDLLDDATKGQVEKAKADFIRVQAEATSFKTKADQADAYQKELQQLQTGMRHQQQTQQQQQNQPPSFEQRIEKMYIDEFGATPEQAKQHAKIQGRIAREMGTDVRQFVDGRVGPLAGNIAMQEASQEFAALDYHPEVGEILRDNPELKQTMWEKTTAYVEAGNQVTNDFLVNLAKIVSFGHNSGSQRTTVTQPALQQQQVQGTRYTFPGAGHSVKTPIRGVQQTQMDPETAAAAEQTRLMMKSGGTALPKITRNGR